MRVASSKPAEWIDGFLFVGNRPILDFLNTKPILEQGETELLVDFYALERWLAASAMIKEAKAKRVLRGWRHASEAAQLVRNLILFRERLREAVQRLESGSMPSEEFLREVNAGLLQHPATFALRKRDGRVVRELSFDLKRPSDLWAPIFNGVADLLSEPDTARLRQCEACEIHFFDTSKKGSRRWCSMNLCGNKHKVAAYQRRKRVATT